MNGRLICVSEKIGREVTGLNGSVFVHCEFDRLGRLTSLELSEKGKDDSTLDKVLRAVSDSVNDIIKAGVV